MAHRVRGQLRRPGSPGGELPAGLVSALRGADDARAQVTDGRVRRRHLHGGRDVDRDSLQQLAMLCRHRPLPLSRLHGRIQFPQLPGSTVQVLPCRDGLSVRGPGQRQPGQLPGDRPGVIGQPGQQGPVHRRGADHRRPVRQGTPLAVRSGGQMGMQQVPPVGQRRCVTVQAGGKRPGREHLRRVGLPRATRRESGWSRPGRARWRQPTNRPGRRSRPRRYRRRSGASRRRPGRPQQ